MVGTTIFRVARSRELDPAFLEVEQSAYEARGKALEELAIEFGTQGTLEDVYHQGLVVGEKINYGPHALLQFLLRGHMRDKYGTDRVEQDMRVSTAQPPPLVSRDDDAARLLAQIRKDIATIDTVRTDVEDLL
jgi:hypothetical protein